MQGKIDTSFQTLQRDFFNSGLAATIGMNAFGVWLAIKNHADYNTGECWPGMRRLAELTGIATGSVQRAIKALEQAKLLRVEQGPRKVNRYVARERMDVSMGSRILCTIILDYVPRTLRKRVAELEQSLMVGENNPELWAQVEIIPGPGFTWDAAAGMLRATLPASELPPAEQELEPEQLESSIVKRVLALKDKANDRQKG